MEFVIKGSWATIGLNFIPTNTVKLSNQKIAIRFRKIKVIKRLLVSLCFVDIEVEKYSSKEWEDIGTFTIL